MPFKRSRMQALREAKERDVISEPTQAEIADLQNSWFKTDNLTTLLASTSNGEGAALIGIEDSGALIAATTVEGALSEIATNVAAIGTPVQLKGTWDASSGSFPGGGSAQAGWSYIVSTGGTVDSVVFVAGDRIIAITNNASTSTYAANWHHLDYTDQVSSVDGQTGAVDLSSSYLALVDTPVTVAGLPGSPSAGQRAIVSDANATTFASVVAGSGANIVPVYYDGTNWRIG